ncbi:MAG: polyphosphate polymerase domain-containing protein [Clostridium sp.]|uniref:polyphosphate polymerase domain-containing protein n=1 Tax=Clostridium culturomicium TaxID=1499683 RepID=UPI00058C0B0C|nr:polyphosphate polymerase domain-containing protein [Clostridium culturomicium]MDU4889456.1 polyphosphate polymerase domain-containing protein [Clostridium sp.]MDU7082900.1 polyphosphate polymerase domain-containing protein [Clostridium sp.]
MYTVLRKEEKYLVDLTEAAHFSKMFNQVLEKDNFSKNGSYTVRSLYFDTVDDIDFFDKINEQELRRKIRLRIYSPKDKTAKLELKQKQNVYQKKRSMTISREDAMELINGNVSVLLKYGNDFADEMYSIMSMNCYRPKTIVEYQRSAFMAKENNIRITFDSNIQATESSFDLFDENLLLYNVLDLNSTIIEVKYDKFMLGYISEIISCINRRSVSSSKYCLARSIGYPLYL